MNVVTYKLTLLGEEAEAVNAAGSPAALLAGAPGLIAALLAARENLLVAIRANVDVPGFDPTQHVTIKKIDAALAKVRGGR